MKLPIKKKWFDKIKSGEKIDEIRDAHFTFVCEETGETLRMEIVGAWLEPRFKSRALVYAANGRECPREFDKMFEDDFQVVFRLEDRRSRLKEKRK